MANLRFGKVLEQNTQTSVPAEISEIENQNDDLEKKIQMVAAL